MRISIAYATKTGTTEQAAAQLAEALRARGCDVTVTNLAKARPDLTADAFALGGSVRMGRWNRRARWFAKRNTVKLLQKPLALFACRCGQDDLRAMFAAQVGEPLTDHAVFADCLGGTMELSRQKGLDRYVVQMIQKSDAAAKMVTPGILTESVENCANALVGALIR